MRIDELAPINAVESIVAFAQEKASGYTCISTAHMSLLVHENPEFKAAVNGARYNITDSRVQQFVLTLTKGAPLHPTILASDLMIILCRKLAAKGISIALVGGRDDALLGELQATLRLRVPQLNIAYSYAPPFRPMSDEESIAICEAINNSGAGLVFVGLGCPKQERWMAANSSRIGAHLIGVGAAFDWNSGAVPKSPKWVHASGLEWLHRTVREPRRLWRRYLVGGPKFLLAVVMEMTLRSK
jgi:N-acetylglucosaminyldiphosphoundecaprenol N-acetyl-beta-D-mannosaminyltransferase